MIPSQGKSKHKRPSDDRYRFHFALIMLSALSSLIAGCASDVQYTTPSDKPTIARRVEFLVESPPTRPVWHVPGDVIAYFTRTNEIIRSGEFLLAPIPAEGQGIVWIGGAKYPVLYYADWEGESYRVLSSGQTIPGVSSLGLLTFLVLVDNAGNPKYGLWWNLEKDLAQGSTIFNPVPYQVTPKTFRFKIPVDGSTDNRQRRYALIYRGKDGAILRFAIQDLQTSQYIKEQHAEARPAILQLIPDPASHNIEVISVANDQIEIRAVKN